MQHDLEQFVEISELSPVEAAALQQYLADCRIKSMAEKISEKAFFAGNIAALPDFPESSDLARAWFAAAFLSFEYSRKCYRALHYPEAVWRDSMTDLKVWLRNEQTHRQVIGLGALARPWQVVLYCGSVTRHGRLECNSSFTYQHAPLYDRQNQLLLQSGDPVINLHIPEDGPMDLAACSDSLRRMADFFAVCRSDYQWKGFLCESWLLDEQLKNLLPATSNIIKFQSLGIKYPLKHPSDAVVRIFGSTDYRQAVCSSTLQRNAAAFLNHGGTFMEEGIFIPRAVIENFDFDLLKLLQHQQNMR